jgi:MFS family permease
MSALQAEPKFLGWRMIAIAFTCANVTLGFTFGAYGAFVAEISKEYPASRSLLSGGLALVMVMMGLLAPAVGTAITKWSIRRVITLGLLVLSANCALISLAQNAWQFVLIFGIVGGTAAALVVFIPSITLASHWFIKHRGRATGIVLVPVLMVAVPPALAAAMAAYGWRAAALGMAVIVLLVLPLLRFLVDKPEDIGQRPLGDYGSVDTAAALASGAPAIRPLRSPAFWVTTFCGGIVNGSSITIATHIILFATAQGIAFQSAAFLLSILAGVGMLGGIFGGSLADRLGGSLTLALIALLEIIAWAGLQLNFGYWYLAALIGLIGICANGVTPAAAALLAHFFGRQSIGKALGYFALATMPFNFIMPLAAGILFDVSGSYRLAFMIYAGLFVVCVVLLLGLYRQERKQPASP